MASDLLRTVPYLLLLLVISHAAVAQPPLDHEQLLEGGAEVLTRGPVHEAFAEPYSVNAEAALIVSVQPPEPIDELPPEVIPEGENIEWIPGYWAWEDDREQFIWISGVWRDVPPDQRWVPGSWIQVTEGFQWTSGFWTASETAEIAYLPEPPESYEIGPNAPAPDDDHFWVPGAWRYVNADYTWQPGYWAPVQVNWCWIPARYVWTPYGYVFCDGYWDYEVEQRGVLFSPVFFPNYRYVEYVPQAVVDVGPMMIHLFVRTRYSHYYFGDYYDDRYASVGIVPWIQVHQHAFYDYDPLIAYYQSGIFGAGQQGYLGRIAGWHQYYRRNPDFRPRRTWSESRDYAKRRGDRDERVVRHASLTRSLAEFRRADDRYVELRDLEQPRREQFRDRSREIRQLEQLRGGARDRDRGREDRRLALPKVEQRVRRSDLPERPDRDPIQSRRSARPELGETERERGSNQDARTREGQGAGRRNQNGPDANDRRRGESKRANDRGNRQNAGQREERNRSRDRLPDAPAEGGLQDSAPIPRPSNTPRRQTGPERRDSGTEQRRENRETRRPESPNRNRQPEPQRRERQDLNPAESRRSGPVTDRNRRPDTRRPRGAEITPRSDHRGPQGGADRGRNRGADGQGAAGTRRPDALDATPRPGRSEARRGADPGRQSPVDKQSGRRGASPPESSSPRTGEKGRRESRGDSRNPDRRERTGSSERRTESGGERRRQPEPTQPRGNERESAGRSGDRRPDKDKRDNDRRN